MKKAGIVRLGIKRGDAETIARTPRRANIMDRLLKAFVCRCLARWTWRPSWRARGRGAAKLAEGSTDHWVDQMVNPQFTKSQRPNTTLLVSGLTQAHDYLVKAALSGIGYKVEVIDCRTTTPSATARSSATVASATPPTSPWATW